MSSGGHEKSGDFAAEVQRGCRPKGGRASKTATRQVIKLSQHKERPHARRRPPQRILLKLRANPDGATVRVNRETSSGCRRVAEVVNMGVQVAVVSAAATSPGVAGVRGMDGRPRTTWQADTGDAALALGEARTSRASRRAYVDIASSSRRPYVRPGTAVPEEGKVGTSRRHRNHSPTARPPPSG